MVDAEILFYAEKIKQKCADMVGELLKKKAGLEKEILNPTKNDVQKFWYKDGVGILDENIAAYKKIVETFEEALKTRSEEKLNEAANLYLRFSKHVTKTSTSTLVVSAESRTVYD